MSEAPTHRSEPLKDNGVVRIIVGIGIGLTIGFGLVFMVASHAVPLPQSEDHIKNMIHENVEIRCWKILPDGGLP